MERRPSIESAREILANNFIGIDELEKISSTINFLELNLNKKNIPEIPFSIEFLSAHKDEYILILGIPYLKGGSFLNLVSLREYFGFDPQKFQPCFYNQDWYLKEKFATDTHLNFEWYLLLKDIPDDSRGVDPKSYVGKLSLNSRLPTAMLCAYTFFIYFFYTGNILWQEDYIWCEDLDICGDQIYVGRYSDPTGLCKNGFSIHRHLSLKRNYGIVNQIIS